jgi:hypothetical protein
MPAKRSDLVDWVHQALAELGGEARIPEIAKQIWKNHEKDLKGSDIFYTWQYDMRWAANRLRHQKILGGVGSSARGVWALKC